MTDEVQGEEVKAEESQVEATPAAEAPEAVPAEPQAEPAAAGELSKEEKDARQWAMFLHLSQLAGYVLPLAGVIAPIVMWQIKKDELPGVDEHGKTVVNWLISAMIYGIVGVILMFVFVGIFVIMILGVLAVVYPIIGAVKANEGEVWKYPGAIQFLK